MPKMRIVKTAAVRFWEVSTLADLAYLDIETARDLKAGEVLELEAEKAEDLIARNLARPAGDEPAGQGDRDALEED